MYIYSQNSECASGSPDSGAICEGYENFANITESIRSLFVLLTTANNPDGRLAEQLCSPNSVCVYLLLSVIHPYVAICLSLCYCYFFISFRIFILSIRWPVCLIAVLSLCHPVYLAICLSVCPPVCQYLFVCLSVDLILSICLNLC